MWAAALLADQSDSIETHKSLKTDIKNEGKK
jgi:hypothetical protein